MKFKNFLLEQKINNKEVEWRTQPHLMDVSGAHDKKVTKKQLIDYIKKEGYIASDLDISFDNFQGLWRWSADIKKI